LILKGFFAPGELIVEVVHRSGPTRTYAMQNTARHLYRSRHGIWYVRFIVPGDLRRRYPELPKELRRSTQTSQLRAARRFAQQLLGQWLTGISLASLDRTMSSDKDKRLDGVFRLMKVPGFEEPQPPTADPRSISPMVVERDPVTSRITRAELEPHDTAKTAKLLFKYLQDQSAAEAAERNAAAASSAGRPVDTPLLPKGPSDNKQESIVPTNIQPTDKPSIWLSQAIKEYIELARNQQELSANTITYTHDPSLRLFRALISEKRRVFGHPDTMGKWDIRLDEITPEKMDAFIAAFWSFPSRQGKRPKDADAKELVALGGTPQSHTNTISRLKHIEKLRLVGAICG